VPLLVKAGLASSNSDAIRKIKEGAVYVAGEKVTDAAKEWKFTGPVSARLGRRSWAKLKP
jgi:tyrosyl-tRNA synthetase